MMAAKRARKSFRRLASANKKIRNKKMDAKMCTTYHVRRWICVLKEIKKEHKSMKETTFEVILD